MRGGQRAGKLAGKYPNRTDLAGKTKLPVTVGPSQYYGQATASAAAQKAVPEGNPPVAQPLTSGGAIQGSAPSLNTGWQPGMPPPAALGQHGINPLSAPTQRPNEPLTTGLPSGPGAGPEALQQFAPDPMATARAVVNSIPNTHLTPQLQALRNALTASATNANNPSTAAQ